MENHQNLSGRLDNNFDTKKVQTEVDLSVEVSKQSSTLIAQSVAKASDYLSKVDNYENALAVKNYLQNELKQPIKRFLQNSIFSITRHSERSEESL
ncbi:MAG: hypothetical protein IKI22_01295 [Neisseriaceae bacterium]|nr:hypothetical protein [Neisseriaceae bacterium]